MKKTLFLFFSFLLTSCSEGIVNGLYESNDFNGKSFYLFHDGDFIYINRCGMFHIMGRGKYLSKRMRLHLFYDSLSINETAKSRIVPSDIIYDGNAFSIKRKCLEYTYREDSVMEDFLKKRIKYLKSDTLYKYKFDW